VGVPQHPAANAEHHRAVPSHERFKSAFIVSSEKGVQQIARPSGRRRPRPAPPGAHRAATGWERSHLSYYLRSIAGLQQHVTRLTFHQMLAV
jgi:hypothetical protein